MKNFLFVASGMLGCIIILIAILVVGKYYNRVSQVVPPSSSKNISNSQPNIQEIRDTSINICTKQYPNYPLLSSILTTPADRNLGVYSGKITSVDSGQRTITVISQTSSQPFTFQNASVNTVLYAANRSKINDFTVVKTGTKAVVSFPCKQQPGSFVLNQFQLVL